MRSHALIIAATSDAMKGRTSFGLMFRGDLIGRATLSADHLRATPAIRRALVVYLACCNRPIHEVLFPAVRDISQEYGRTFKGMTAEPIELSKLLAARGRLLRELQQGLDKEERNFLISFVRNQPDWSLLGIPHLAELPGIRWKPHNLAQLGKLSPKKFATHAETLERLLRR